MNGLTRHQLSWFYLLLNLVFELKFLNVLWDEKTLQSLLLIVQFFYLILCNQYIARNMANIKTSCYIFPLISEPRFHEHAASTTDLIEFHFHRSLSASSEILDSLYGIARTCLFQFHPMRDIIEARSRLVCHEFPRLL